MLASTIIDLAVSSELKQLSLADMSGTHELRNANRKSILGFINLGLIELHKRFLIRTDTVVLNSPTSDVTNWDLPNTFISPISAITNLYGKVEINKVNADLSLSFPSPYSCRFVNNSSEVLSSVILSFQATSPDIASVKDVVNLPVQFLEALINYVAYKAHATISGALQSENNTYYRRFEASCKKLQSEGLINITTFEPTKLTDRGFP